MKKGNIKKLQLYVHGKIKERGFADETLQESLLLLIEEVGELVKACRHLTGMNVEENKKVRHEAGEEVADVINIIIAVGIKLGIDIEKEYLLKEIKNNKRIYKRSSQNIK